MKNMKIMKNEIIKLASEVRYTVTEIKELQSAGKLTYSDTEKLVMISHNARHESLKPLIKVMKLETSSTKEDNLSNLFGCINKLCECKSEHIRHIDNFSDRMKCIMCGKTF